MIVSELKLYNFRKFKALEDAPGLSIPFHSGLNALIGENDSGKSAVIDAIKLVLLTQSNEYIRVTDEDFYTDSNGISVSKLRIDIKLSEFTPNEAKNFIEYLQFEKDEQGHLHYFLNLHYRAWREKNRILTDLRAGDIEDGVLLDGKARELLKCVYLRPLRDAEREMSSGRNSRISQILLSHPRFKNSTDHMLITILKEANEKISKYFTEEDGKVILTTIQSTLGIFHEQDSNSNAQLRTSDYQLKSILESLSLAAPEIHPGLGELNLLFIAAELLLLQHDENGGARLALIEELEAHLHPQAQLRLIEYLQKEYSESGIQIIISTHSTVLASRINLKNLILLKNGKGYDLSTNKTKLCKGDYLFLQRFLDSTKANLFFAKGVIMVEGDAENLVVPMIAEIIGYPLEKYGVSIVNVGSTAFLRYSNIFIRTDGQSLDVPVSVITDCDVRPEDENHNYVDRSKEMIEAVQHKEAYYTHQPVKGFIAPQWTFEYCLALSSISGYFHKAVHYGKKIKNSEKYALTDDKIKEANDVVAVETEQWAELSGQKRAHKMYRLMLDDSNKSGLKAIVGQCLAAMLKWEISDIPDGITQESMFDTDLYQLTVNEEKRNRLKDQIVSDRYIAYIVDAIKYATRQ